jgi:hypothetical protein
VPFCPYFSPAFLAENGGAFGDTPGLRGVAGASKARHDIAMNAIRNMK